METVRRRASRRLRSFALLACLLGAGVAQAASHTWTGAVNGNWSNGGNWGGGAPTAGEPSVVLNFPSGTTNIVNTNDILGLTLQSVVFTDGSFIIGGNAVTLTGGITFNGSVTSNFAQFNCDVTLVGTPAVTTADPRGVGLNGVLVGAGGLTKDGTGALQVFGANTYAGTTAVNGGSLTLFNGTGLGSAAAGTSVAGGAALFVFGGLTVAEPLTLAADGRLQGVGGANVWSGPVLLNGTARMGSNLSPASLTVTGLISGPGGLIDEVGGPLTLVANNTYLGGTTLGLNAKLYVNGSQSGSAVAMNAATLGGTGTVGSISSGGLDAGVLSPGVDGPGILHSGALDLQSPHSYAFQLNGVSAGSGYDRLEVNGTANVNGATLLLTPASAAPVGSAFTIIRSSGPLSGTFGGLPDDAVFFASFAAADSPEVAGQSFRINYTPNAVVLRAVPYKGDTNGDAFTDLVFRNQVSGRNVVWLMNDVTRVGGLFVTPDPASLDWRVAGVDNFNNDGRNDLMFWNSSTGAVEFWVMGGTNGTDRQGAAVALTGAAPLSVSWKPSATADFNHDGHPDIVWRDFTTQKIVIWKMGEAAAPGTQKTGTIVPAPDQAADGNWEIVAALDFDNDGNNDLLWYNSTSGKIVQWLMNASVQRTLGRFTNPPNAGDNNWKVVAGGDYGVGSGGLPATNDVVWRNDTSGKLVVWHMDLAGNRTFGRFTVPSAPGDPLNWRVVGPR